MEVQLTSDQQALARHAVEAGRLQSEEDAVREALDLWEERERRRIEFRATIDEARASLARGEGREIAGDSMQDLSTETKERGQARLLDAEEWSRELAAWSESHTTATPLIPDEALDRDSIYGARPVNGNSSRYQHPGSPRAAASSQRACCCTSSEGFALKQ